MRLALAFPAAALLALSCSAQDPMPAMIASLTAEVNRLASRAVPGGVLCPPEPAILARPAVCQSDADSFMSRFFAPQDCYIDVRPSGWNRWGEEPTRYCCHCEAYTGRFVWDNPHPADWQQVCAPWHAYVKATEARRQWEQANCLVMWRSSTGSFRTASQPLGNIDQLQGAWSLPADVMTRLRTIVIANSVTFQSFHLVLNVDARSGQLTEYVGTARQHNGHAQIALAHVHADIVLRQQYTYETVRSCKRCNLIKTCCSNKQIAHPRGLNEAELSNVETALRATSYQKLVGMMQQAPTSFAANSFAAEPQQLGVIGSIRKSRPRPPAAVLRLVANQEGSGSQPGVFDRLTSGINTITSTWQSVVTAFKTTTSTTIQNQIAGVGWDHLKQSVSVRRITGLRPEALDIVIARTITDMNIPAQYHEQAKYSLFLVQYADSQEWVKFDMLFNTGSGGEVSYVCIMGNNEAETGKTNWVMANMQATFRLAPDVMVIRKSGSYAGGIFENTKDTVRHVPRSLTQADVENVLNIMTGLVLEKMGNALGLSISLPNP